MQFVNFFFLLCKNVDISKNVDNTEIITDS